MPDAARRIDPAPEASPGPLSLECFAVEPHPAELVPGRPDRAWMDATSGRHAYRCLPLTIANTSGWEVLCPIDVDVTWTGGPGLDDLTIAFTDPSNRHVHFAKSHFASGIVTLHTGWLFRTPPGWGLMAMGPPNHPKDGIAPLNGLIETDWLPYPFTMNWKMTRPGTVRFEKGEPFCFVVPLPHGRLEDFTPVRRALAEDPELERQHAAFRASRESFGKRLAAGEPAATKAPWERHYFLGRVPDHPEVCPVHTNKRRLAPMTGAEPAVPVVAPAPPVETASPAVDPLAALRLLGIDLGAAKVTTLDDLAALLRPLESIARVETPAIIGHNSGADPQASLRIIDRYEPGAAVLCEPDFLDPDEAALLCETFERNRHLTERGATGADAVWNDRFIFINALPASERRAKRLMQDARARILHRLEAHYRPARRLYSDTIQLVRWLEGMEMEVHADNCDHHTGEPTPGSRTANTRPWSTSTTTTRAAI